MDILQLATMWILWCTLHSLLISRFFIKKMKQFLGNKFAYYRIYYNLFSLLTLLPLVIYQSYLPEKIIFSWPGLSKILKYGMYLSSFVLFYGGYRVFDMGYVLGTKQIQEVRENRNIDPMVFQTSGILEYVRHPWYSGAILLVWAYGPVSDVSLIVKLILTAYIITGTFLEEKKLVQEIGQPYLEYRKRVPMFIPWKRDWYASGN